MPDMQPPGGCNIDIVSLFVLVSYPTETDGLTDRDRQRQTLTLRAGGFEHEALAVVCLEMTQ